MNRATFAALAISALALSGNARADLLEYVFTDGANQVSFQIDSHTAPTSYEYFLPYVQNFNISGVHGTAVIDGQSFDTFFNLRYYSAFNMGGMDIQSAVFNPSTNTYEGDGVVGYFTQGAQLYSGEVFQPTLITGTYALTAFIDGNPYTLTVSAVPEPTTWAMLFGGLGVVGAIAQRRRARSQATAG